MPSQAAKVNFIIDKTKKTYYFMRLNLTYLHFITLFYLWLEIRHTIQDYLQAETANRYIVTTLSHRRYYFFNLLQTSRHSLPVILQQILTLDSD